MKIRILAKPLRKEAVGASKELKRLKLSANKEGHFCWPISKCESESYRSKRGCRKHVFTKYGWYFFFDEKPDIDTVFPSINTRENEYRLQRRTQTSTMPMFQKTCTVGLTFKQWLQSPGGGGKPESQADQILCRISMLSDFVEHLQNDWKMGNPGIIGYMNAMGHMLDHRRSCNSFPKENTTNFIPIEIYLHRVKRHLTKKMKITWKNVLTIDYLNEMNCWASLQDLQKVIPFHSDRY